MTSNPDTPNTTDTIAAVRRSFAAQGLMSLLGATLDSIEPGHAEILLHFRDDLNQQHGYFHAGVTAAIADSAGGYAAMSLMPPGADVLSVEFKINLLAPATGPWLRAVADVARRGKTLTVARADVFSSAQPQSRDTLVAAMQQTLIRIDPKPSP